MFRHTLFVVGVALSLLSSAQAQSVCNDSELVFLGRAEAPVTFRVSGEAEIEKARRDAIRAEEEFERLKASGPDWSRDPRTMELTIRMVKAQDELGRRRAMYPPPHDITFIPLAVTRAIRGVNEATLMLHARPHLPPLQPGEEYLVYGERSRQLIPPFPEMGDLASLADYVEGQVAHVSTVQKDLQFLSATAFRATVMGTLRMHSFGNGMPPALGDVRIFVSSGGQVVETTTREDGSFVASGISPGYLDVTAALTPDLTLVDRPTHKPFVRAGGCVMVHLRARVNGRVRGRIISSTGVSLNNVELQLRVARDNRRSVNSHDPQFGTTARADGTFEFSGVSAGSYFLSASVQNSDGRSRSVTYFPGTDDLDAAIPIDVGKATLHEGFDFVIKTE
jgi:hypothetical protein